MKVLVLTAGRGTRLRPHTDSKPKPLIAVAGKPMLAHILDPLQALPIDELIVVTGYLGEQVEAFVRSNYQIPTRFVAQTELRGQAHAIYLAREFITGPTLLLFGDGIFTADLASLASPSDDGIIYVQEVADPQRFGVAVVKDGLITQIVEKPQTPVSNLAAIGVSFYPDGRRLLAAIEAVIERNLQTRGEYYLADALQVMLDEGERFRPEPVSFWADCGTAEALLETNRRLLDQPRNQAQSGDIHDSVIIPPVHIAPSARIERSVVGPYVSVGAGATICDARITDAIINDGAEVSTVALHQSIVGEHARVTGSFRAYNLGAAAEIQS